MLRNTKSPLVLLKNVYFFQAGIGMLANAFLLLFYIFTIPQAYRLRPTDMTTCYLAFVHLVMLIITLDILSENTLQSLNFANELRCKLLLYLSKVMRGLSISTTCLLSIIQVITISPSFFYLSRFKQKLTKLTKHVAIAFFCILSLNLSSNSCLIIYTVVYSNRTNLLNVNKYCSLSSMNSIIMTIFFILALSQNVFSVGMMLLSSMYMVIFLCRHQRKSEYLHRLTISPRFSPAKRATHTVLLLVSFFVIMYCVDSIISFFSSALWKYEPAVLYIQSLLGNIYATVSPLVLISSDKRITGILQNMIAMVRVWTC